MLNAWINRGDILKLLSNSETINDCIERNKFLFEIHKLKQHKKPKKPKKQRTINYLDEIAKLIQNYRYAVKYKGKVSYLEKYIDALSEQDKELFTKNFTEKYGKDMYINIIPFDNLKNIVKVSDRTISRWVAKGFIEPKYYDFTNKPFVYIDFSKTKQ